MGKWVARGLIVWWMAALVFGFFGNIYLALRVLDQGPPLGALVLFALAAGCLVVLYRTFKYRDDWKRIFK